MDCAVPMCLVKRQEVSRRRREWGKGTSEVRRVGKKIVRREKCVRSRAPELSTARTVKIQR